MEKVLGGGLQRAQLRGTRLRTAGASLLELEGGCRLTERPSVQLQDRLGSDTGEARAMPPHPEELHEDLNIDSRVQHGRHITTVSPESSAAARAHNS